MWLLRFLSGERVIQVTERINRQFIECDQKNFRIKFGDGNLEFPWINKMECLSQRNIHLESRRIIKDDIRWGVSVYATNVQYEKKGKISDSEE